MKDIIFLRDNEDYSYIYGALLVDAEIAEELEQKIKEIINHFYDEVIDDYDGNTYSYVMSVLNTLDYEFEEINKVHYANI